MSKHTIESVRASLGAVNDRQEKLDAIPRSRSYISAALAKHVQSAADGYAKSLPSTLRQIESLRGSPDVFATLFAVAGHSTSVNLAGVFATVLGVEATCRALAPVIEALPEGITDEERAARVAEIRTELVRLGHIEEDLIEASEEAGTPIARRGDALPEVVLRAKRP